MNFEKHLELRDKHSFLSPSNYAWLRYTPEHMAEMYEKYRAMERGTKLHAFAKESIELGIKLSTRPRTTLALYVNDAIGFSMTPEVPLYYSDYCFGTTDAISFHNKKLRIHDLKTGVTPASMDQLMIYAGLFCLEYNTNPDKIECELRIYQFDDANIYIPEKGEIRSVCDRIRECSSFMENTFGKQAKKGGLNYGMP